MADVIPLDRDRPHCSGGPLHHGSDDVWAISLLGANEKAHRWMLRGRRYESVCGIVTLLTIHTGQNALFEPGNYPKCKRCMELLRRQSANEQVLQRIGSV